LAKNPSHGLLNSIGSAPQPQKGSATSKQQALWSKILADNNVGGSWPTTFELLGLFTENDNVSGNWHSDLFPPNRMKLIHSVGAAALISWRPASSMIPYTGIFATGAIGLVRAASATEPSTDWFTGAKSMTPGLSLKFFRDNVESSNVLALWSLNGMNSFNFFRDGGFMNHVGAGNLSFTEQLLLDKFKTVSSQPGLVGTSDLAMADANGNMTSPAQALFPFGLIFQTNPAYHALFAGSTTGDVGKMFSSTNFTDPHMSKIYAVDSTDWPPTLIYVGDIYLESEWRASKFADQGIFFRHIFSQQDFDLRPSWKKSFEDPTKKRWEVENFELYKPYLPSW